MRVFRKVFHMEIHREDTDVHRVNPLNANALGNSVSPLSGSVSKNRAFRSSLVL